MKLRFDGIYFLDPPSVNTSSQDHWHTGYRFFKNGFYSRFHCVGVSRELSNISKVYSGKYQIENDKLNFISRFKNGKESNWTGQILKSKIQFFSIKNADVNDIEGDYIFSQIELNELFNQLDAYADKLEEKSYSYHVKSDQHDILGYECCFIRSLIELHRSNKPLNPNNDSSSLLSDWGSGYFTSEWKQLREEADKMQGRLQQFIEPKAATA